MSHKPKNALRDVLPRPVDTTRTDRIKLVLDAIRGTQGRPDLKALEAELFRAQALEPKAEAAVAKPSAAGQSSLVPPKRPDASGSGPSVSYTVATTTTASIRDADGHSTFPQATSQTKAVSSLSFLHNEHPAILAQQMLGQSKAERRGTLETCSGPLARQIRYLLANMP